jgi:inward rectifier potassium channel
MNKSRPPGGIQVKRIGQRRWYWSDTYHWILTLTWPRFFLLISGVYMAANLFFAIAFFAVPGAVANARAGSFLDVFLL